MIKRLPNRVRQIPTTKITATTILVVTRKVSFFSELRITRENLKPLLYVVYTHRTRVSKWFIWHSVGQNSPRTSFFSDSSFRSTVSFDETGTPYSTRQGIRIGLPRLLNISQILFISTMRPGNPLTSSWCLRVSQNLVSVWGKMSIDKRKTLCRVRTMFRDRNLETDTCISLVHRI